MTARKSGMGSHESSRMIKDEWLTPPYILEALDCFDLDPCAPIKRPWKIADYHFTKEDDGLSKDWFGRVWCNPPYGNQTGLWLNKLTKHGDGIALTFARTETKLFFNNVWDTAHGILFLKGRLYFHHDDGTKAAMNAGAPSCLIAYGYYNSLMLKNSGLIGKYIQLKS